MDPVESKPETRSTKPRTRILIAGVALVAVLGFAWFVTRKPPGAAMSNQPEPSWRIKDRPAMTETVLAGDTEHGRRLYSVHCTACHGVKGDGFGPAAIYLWPAPRDHTDGVYMSSRTDAELYTAIGEGGRAVSRSPLMPSWKDRFDSFDIWNLVAFIRTLHPSPLAGAFRATAHEVVLDEGRLKEGGPDESVPSLHRIDFNRLWNEEDEVRSIAAYPALSTAAGPLRLSLLFSPEGTFERGATHRQVLLPGYPAEEFDRWISGGIQNSSPIRGFEELCALTRKAVDSSIRRIREALVQERGDTTLARAVYDRYDKDRGSFPLGQKLYIQNCGSCHGTTGRVVGPWIVERGFRPRNHADGSYMGLLSDDYLSSVTRYGGLYWNLSGAMPAHPYLKNDELKALVEFMRSLAVPPAKERCPCSVMAARCMEPSKEKDGACCCRDGHGTGTLCTHMKR
jgi:cytochrome c oxidase cbb3-type subunit 3